MKFPNKNPLVSVIIVNYNNATLLGQSIKSILNQTYNNIEIIVVDDKSTDNSVNELHKYKNKIRIIKNKKKTSQGSYNQINSYFNGYLKSKGKYLFFLDSDDYFKINKVKYLVYEFEQNNANLIFDLPILKFKKKIVFNKFNQKKFILSSWPRFSPQSCISMKKEYAKEIFKNVKVNKFESIWLDFRIAIYHFLKNKELFVFNKYLTYYRQLDGSASKNFKTLSKNWWYRRFQAHEIVDFFSIKLNQNKKINLDKLITKIVFFFLK
ncbi:glycosyltransferase family 2 protein [Candidatus Pelagibacter sp.]|nr:glycosyltransferase family 2 protein [Candidatus Pelagibacter sp.]